MLACCLRWAKRNGIFYSFIIATELRCSFNSTMYAIAFLGTWGRTVNCVKFPLETNAKATRKNDYPISNEYSRPVYLKIQRKGVH